MFEVITPNTAPTRFNRRPLRSIASIVLAKVGVASLSAIASTSRRCSAIAYSKAVGNSSGVTRSKGGRPSNGPGQSASNTLSGIAGLAWAASGWAVCAISAVAPSAANAAPLSRIIFTHLSVSR